MAAGVAYTMDWLVMRSLEAERPGRGSWVVLVGLSWGNSDGRRAHRRDAKERNLALGKAPTRSDFGLRSPGSDTYALCKLGQRT